MEYYYTPPKYINLKDRRLILTDFEYHHLVNVLRKKPGQNITITDGKRNIYHCTIVEITGTEIICNIDKTEYNINEPGLFITLYMSPLRNQSRFEFAIEKAVEIGVGKIVPVIFRNTVKKIKYNRKKILRMQKILIGAMGQSQRCHLPEFSEEIDFTRLLSHTKNEKNKLILYESGGKSTFELPDKANVNVSMIIGPEGGFDKREIEQLRMNNWDFLNLGPRKYRAETAAIISIFKILN